jgi:NADH-quinone oxidoreductase subunit G
MAKVKIDGREVEVPNGTTILQAAEKLGLEVPQMCYHPGLRVVGVCRVCLCQIKGQPKMTPACATEIRDGMEVGLYTPEAEKARRSVIEFWLLNHPLDCPVCDQGGECPLQDIAFDHGPGVSRLNDAKVKKSKRVELGEHVILDEERCILCWRCTRFTQEVSGSNQMMLSDRGVYTTVGTPPGQIFDDPFSGNVVDLCPVGALTSRDFRFKSRVWEMSSAESVCTACAVGCNTYLWSKKGRIERQTSRPNPQVNDYWLCDRGRYETDFINDPSRLTLPRLRVDGKLIEVEWTDAMSALNEAVKPLAARGQNQAGALFSRHLANEEYWSFMRFLRGGLGTNNLSAERAETLTPVRAALATRGRLLESITQIEGVDAILIAGGDLERTHPVYSLRVRKAVRQKGVKLFVATPEACSLDLDAAECERVAPARLTTWLHELSAKLQGHATEGMAGKLAGVKRLAVLLNGGAQNIEAVGALESLLGSAARDASWRALVLDEGGNAGAVTMLGISPHYFPGQRPITPDEAQVWKTKWGGRVTAEHGFEWKEMLAAAADGRIRALFLVNAGRPARWKFSPEERALLARAPFVAAFDLFADEVSEFAHVVIPTTSFAETDATYTTADGVVQLARRNIVPVAPTLLQTLHRVAAAAGVKLKGPQPAEVFRELSRDVPAYAGLDYGKVMKVGARGEGAKALAAAGSR